MEGRTAAVGFSVSMGSFLATRLTNLAITVMLARSLGPAEMGLVAFALLAIEVFDAIRDFGMRDALIYDRSADPTLRTTAFATILVIGFVQAAVLLALAPLAPALIDSSEVTLVLMWLALLFPINATSSMQMAVLQRDFCFGKLAVAEILSAVAKTGVAITLIQLGYGVWSIVVGILVGAAVRSVALWIASKWRPAAVRPTWEKFAELLEYGRHIVGANIVNIVQARVDQMVIVTVLGEPALGLYYIAARIPEIAIHGVGSVITTIVFPALSGVSEDLGRLRSAYGTCVTATMALIAPASLGMASTAGLLVPVLFGTEWKESVTVFVLLALTGLPVALGWMTGDFFKATGRPQYLFMLMAAESAYLIPLVILAALSPFGIVAVAAAMLIGESLAATLRIIVLYRAAKIPPSVTLAAAARPVICALVMALGAHAWILSNPLALPPVWLLATAIAIGGIIYLVLLALVDRETVSVWYRSVVKTDA